MLENCFPLFSYYSLSRRNRASLNIDVSCVCRWRTYRASSLFVHNNGYSILTSQSCVDSIADVAEVCDLETVGNFWYFRDVAEVVCDCLGYAELHIRDEPRLALVCSCRRGRCRYRRGDCLASKLLHLLRGKIRNRGYFEKMVMEALVLVLELICMRVKVSDSRTMIGWGEPDLTR